MTTTMPIRKHTLANGLTILGEPNPAAKSAALGFFVKTGARDEVGPEAGVSHFLEHMMFKGTERRSSLQLTYEMGNIAVQSNAFTSEENTVFYGAVLPEYFDQFTDILCDMLRSNLDPQEFAMEKKVILEEIALYQDRPHFFLFEQATTDYYQGHPAGNSVLGTIDSITAVTRDQMKAYFDRRYAPGAMAVVATGNYDWDAFVAAIESRCGAWQNHATPRDTSRYTGPELKKVYSKKNITQAHVVLVADGPSASDKERFAMDLLARIIGDSSGSKLYWALVDTGRVEAAEADSDERDGTGTFSVYASTEPDKLDGVVSTIREILAKPLDFSEAELTRAKTKAAAKVVLGGELPMGRMMSIGMSWNARKEVRSLVDIKDTLLSVTRNDIEAALKKFPLTRWSEFRLVPG